MAKKVLSVMLLIVGIILGSQLTNVPKVSAETIVRVYDYGVYAMTKALEENGVPVTFVPPKRPLSSNPEGNVPYIYDVNFDKEISIAFSVNGEGYIEDIVIFPHSASIANYEKVVIQICKILGMNNDEAKFLFDNRASKQGIALVNCADKNRSFIMQELEITNGVGNRIFAIK